MLLIFAVATCYRPTTAGDWLVCGWLGVSVAFMRVASQGIAWIKRLEASRLTCCNISDADVVHLLCSAVSNGAAVLLEGVSESIDAALWPLVSRSVSKKGQRVLVR